MSNDYRWLTPMSRKFLETDYLEEGHTVDRRVDVICDVVEHRTKKRGIAKKLKKNIQKGWYSLSSPIWSNFGTTRGLPISCFGSYVGDSMSEILHVNTEIGMMTKYGGGTSAYFGDVRSRGSDIKDNGKSSGSVHFMEMPQSTVKLISQGSTRRGNCAVYQHIEHPDIMEFLNIRNEGSPIQDLSFGVCVTDKFMKEMIDGDYNKRVVWARVLESRQNTGFPFIFFVDNANNNAPDVYRDLCLKILHTNLCTEIMLPNGKFESFVCDLMSMNDLYFDEWGDDPEAVEIAIYVLEAVMDEFIERSAKIPELARAHKFAVRHRALGLGQLGWHSYLQSKMIAFESMEAKRLNIKIAKTIQKQAMAASVKMAKEYGEPELLKGYGRRHATLIALAPTKSSSFILGQVSASIEPFGANYVIEDLAKGKFTTRNPYLTELLEKKGENKPETWSSILKKGGSVQHLSCLTKHEKDVFKTMSEISPKEIIIQAVQRQKYIDQGQSLNLLIHPSTPAKEVNALLIYAWENQLKSLYYQYNVNAAQEFAKSILACSSCES